MPIEILTPVASTSWVSQSPPSANVYDSIPVSRKIVQNITEYTSLPSLPLFATARDHALAEPSKAAIIDKTKNESFTYTQLLHDVAALKASIEQYLHSASETLEEPRVAFLVPAGYDYVVVQWAIWAAGAICVPMCMCFLLESARPQTDVLRHFSSA